MQFHAYPVWLNVGIFFVAALFVWLAGTRLATYADAIGVRTKLNHALLGLILLGVATFSPRSIAPRCWPEQPE